MCWDSQVRSEICVFTVSCHCNEKSIRGRGGEERRRGLEEAGEEKKEEEEEEEEGKGGATIQHVPETMLITLILTLLLSVATATQFKTAYFNQTLDHFDENNTKVWKQRYLFSDEYWGKPKDART